MHYRAVGNRCAVHLANLKLSITEEEVSLMLQKLGFSVVDVDVISIARGLIGKVSYRLGASISEAPNVVDCSSFTKWLYAQKGIWLPRLSIQQRQEGIIPDTIERGDLLFTVGYKNYYDIDPGDEVGHVGIATGEGTVIHAANAGVVESSIKKFRGSKPRGVRRIALESAKTLISSSVRLVESSDDIRWLLLRNLA